ncbi:hypothetical protein ETU08_05140 [Apibacter muscae]|uniref:hypothetical protein n=1 Tax=Apibacter muscae TaxID=2509004 RepID=UPI0011AD55F3|nr:hypothetical protein [Apibacter muscae]TWP29947.1 hypothetical protein ETU08_05140 [Apibacter muscae]
MKFNHILIYSISFLLLSCNSNNKDSSPADLSSKEITSSNSLSDEVDWENDFKPFENNHNISAEKKSQIAILKKELGFKMKAIGMDPKLSGYEKGVEKRKLKSQYLSEINKLINGEQSGLNSAFYDNPELAQQYQKFNELELQLDKLENEYDLQKDQLERQENSLSKNKYKKRKEELKSNYKRKKDYLKMKMDSIILISTNK